MRTKFDPVIHRFLGSKGVFHGVPYRCMLRVRYTFRFLILIM